MYCKNCGAKLGADVKFCGSCGKEVLANSATTPASVNSLATSQSFITRLYTGRIGRKYWLLGILFWFVALFVLLIGGVLLLSPSGDSSDSFVWLFFILVLGFWFLAFSLNVRRLHDMNDTGWKVLFFLIPVINLVMLIWLVGTKGTEGRNTYGEIPSDKIGFFEAILNLKPPQRPTVKPVGPEELLIDSVQSLRMRIKSGGGTYSETLTIAPKGFLDMSKSTKDSVPSFFATIGSESPEALINYAQKIKDRFPEFVFTFERDPENKWIKYTVGLT